MLTEERAQTRTIDWPRLVRWSGVGLALLLAAAAAGFRDVEAAAFAVGAAAALGLLRFRTGLLGLLALGALFADVAAFMLPGAVSNIVHREAWVATALPSALGLISLAGLAAVVAGLLERRGVRLPGARAVALMALVLILGANVAGVAAQAGGDSPIRPGDIAITMQHVKFTPDNLEASAGAIGATVGNLDLFWHTFTIRELGVNLNVPVQAERRVTFRAEPGVYEFVCAIPGHTQAGMKGTLTVR